LSFVDNLAILTGITPSRLFCSRSSIPKLLQLVKDVRKSQSLGFVV
jgi:hypothetical protein